MSFICVSLFFRPFVRIKAISFVGIFFDPAAQYIANYRWTMTGQRDSCVASNKWDEMEFRLANILEPRMLNVEEFQTKNPQTHLARPIREYWLNSLIDTGFWSWHWVDICHLVCARAQRMKSHSNTNSPQSKCQSHAAEHRFGVVIVLVKLWYNDAFAFVSRHAHENRTQIKWNNLSNSLQTLSLVFDSVTSWYECLQWSQTLAIILPQFGIPI